MPFRLEFSKMTAGILAGGALIWSSMATSPALAAQAQENAEAAITTATPAMWEVTDEDSEFILLGTFHILPPSLNWRSPEIADAIERADVVYFEVDAESPSAQSKTVSAVMTQGFFTNGDTLETRLDAADAAKLKEIVSQIGLPLAAINPMRPWNAFLTLTVQFIVQQGFDPASGVDSVLLAEARTRGKEIVFLETIEQQLGLFTGLDPQAETDLLVMTIRDWENQSATFDELFAAWATGDTSALNTQMNQPMREETPKLFDRLLVDRNRAWADRLAADLKNGSGVALVAVGAAHLVGDEHSVPAMMASMGYDVRRLNGPQEESTGDDGPNEDIAENGSDEAQPSDSADQPFIDESLMLPGTIVLQPDSETRGADNDNAADYEITDEGPENILPEAIEAEPAQEDGTLGAAAGDIDDTETEPVALVDPIGGMIGEMVAGDAGLDNAAPVTAAPEDTTPVELVPVELEEDDTIIADDATQTTE